MDYIYKKKDIKNKIWIFLLVFIPKAILCLFSQPVAYTSDEVATMSGGAFWSGLDWSGVVSHAGYYGTGFTAFSAIFYKLTDDPWIIYVCTALLCTFAQSITAVIACSILQKFFKIQNWKYITVISVACGYFVITASAVIFNEHAIVLVSWIVAWLLLKLHESIDRKKAKFVYTVLLFLIMAYGLTIHTRMLIFWAALAVTVIFYAWTYRRCLISLPGALLTAIVGYIGANAYVHFTQNKIWHAGAENLRNASVGGGILDSLYLLLSPKSWQAWLNIIFGQLHTIAVFTGGLFIILIVVFIHFMWNKLVRKCWNEENQGIEAQMMPVVVFFSACIAATIAAQSITWLKGSINVINAGFENNLYDSKAYGYLRYFGPYCGPVLLMGAVFFYYWKGYIFLYKKIIIAAWAGLEFYWLVCIFPYIYHTDQIGAIEFYCPFSLHQLYDIIDIHTLLPASIVLAVSLFLILYLLKKNKLKTVFIWVGLIFIYIYFYIGITWDIKFAQDNRVFAYNSYEVISEVEDSVDIPDEIYVYDSWQREDHNNYYLYQVLLPRYKIIPELPSEELESAVLFTNDISNLEWAQQSWHDQGYKYYVVGQYELLLVKGEELQQQFIQAGIALE